MVLMEVQKMISAWWLLLIPVGICVGLLAAWIWFVWMFISGR